MIKHDWGSSLSIINGIFVGQFEKIFIDSCNCLRPSLGGLDLCQLCMCLQIQPNTPKNKLFFEFLFMSITNFQKTNNFFCYYEIRKKPMHQRVMLTKQLGEFGQSLILQHVKFFIFLLLHPSCLQNWNLARKWDI